MKAIGLDASIAGIAEAYRDFLDFLVADESDADAGRTLTSGNLEVHCASIMMGSIEEKARLARTALTLACPGLMTAVAVAETE
jgi:2-phospho-L-lactate transferase/gluconeogenesis factor (CofD/UPF0052 family)